MCICRDTALPMTLYSSLWGGGGNEHAGHVEVGAPPHPSMPSMLISPVVLLLDFCAVGWYLLRDAHIQVSDRADRTHSASRTVAYAAGVTATK